MQNNPDKQINVRMTFELYKNSKRLADNSGWTLAAWIRKAMEEKVSRDSGTENAPADAGPFTRAEIEQMIKNGIQKELANISSSIPMKKEEMIIRR